MITSFVISVLVSTDYICLIQFEIFLIHVLIETWAFWVLCCDILVLTQSLPGWFLWQCSSGERCGCLLPAVRDGRSRFPLGPQPTGIRKKAWAGGPLPRYPGLHWGSPRWLESWEVGTSFCHVPHSFLCHHPRGNQEGFPSLCPPRGCGDTVVC